MRLAVVAVLLALACASIAEEIKVEEVKTPALLGEDEPVAAAASVEALLVEAPKAAKASRSNDAPKVYYARPAQPAAQARDGAHHHHEHDAQQQPAYPQPQYDQQPQAYPQQGAQYEQPQQAYPQQPQYEQPSSAYAQQQPQAYEQPQAYSVPSYEAAPQSYPAPVPAYQPPAPQAYEAPAAAPAYSTPGHQGYYYYYYPVKDSKVKFKLPKLPKLPSLPSLHLPQSYGKDGGVASVKGFGVAALTAALVGVGAFFSLPILGLGFGKRSFSSLWESEYLSRDNLNVLADYVLNMVDAYQQKYQ